MKSKNKQQFNEGNDFISMEDEDTIENMMRSDSSNSQHEVKELFNEDKVKGRSDISPRQVKMITKAYYLGEITGMKEIHAILKDFLLLSISKDRKSRMEYVEGLKARLDDSLRQNNMMRGQFGK